MTQDPQDRQFTQDTQDQDAVQDPGLTQDMSPDMTQDMTQREFDRTETELQLLARAARAKTVRRTRTRRET